jgi:hypothetical protein
VSSSENGQFRKSESDQSVERSDGANFGLDQLQPFQARMPVLADDDVVVHGDAGRAMSMIALVIWMSACDGVGSPEGWLRINRLKAKIALHDNYLGSGPK